MSIQLRENETISAEVNFHWSAFLIAKFWAALGCLLLFGAFVGSFSKNSAEKPSSFGAAIFMSFIFFTPFLYKWMQNKTKKYLVTNQRVYIEEGVLSKSKRDLPLNKLNDISVQQNIFQRVFGSGNIVMLMGNDKPIVIRDVEHSEAFKNRISEMLEKRSA